ncbi:MAG: hypothetical protein AAF573_12815 [Bacteroidota bacterium]
MIYKFLSTFLLLLLLACNNTSTNSPKGELWTLVSQDIMAIDTIYATDTVGNPLDQILRIDTTQIPFRASQNETWTFTGDQKLIIQTLLRNQNTHTVEYEVIRTETGFIFKRGAEERPCDIVKKDDKEMILSSNGKIVLRRR